MPAEMLSAAVALRDQPAFKAQLVANARAYIERAHAPAMGEGVCVAIEAAIARAAVRQDTL